VVVVEAEELAEQEGSSRLAEVTHKAEAGMGLGIVDEDEDELGGDATAAGMDRRAVGSVGKTGASMAVVAEVAVGSARRHAPWSSVCLEEALD
jgi:hypothetical protein